MTTIPVIRAATLADVPAIQRVHAGCDDPWADPATCAIWVNHRILRGFFIDVAEANGEAVGHAEWIVSDEPAPFRRTFYLGLLEIRADHQRRGIGRAMVEHGLRRAGRAGYAAVRTVPEKTATGFYQALGFAPCFHAHSYTVDLDSESLPADWRRLRSVPRRAVGRIPMQWGWVQGSSAHMWEICNRPVRAVGDKVACPCAGRSDGAAYVQLHCWAPGPQALAVAWAPRDHDTAELLTAAMALARRLPISTLNVAVLEDHARALTANCNAVLAGRHDVWSRQGLGEHI